MSTQWSQIKPSDILDRTEIRDLSQQSSLWGFWLTAHAWSIILSAAALYALFPNVLTALVAIILVGGRQLGLAILMHEASHGMLFKSRRVNDWIGQALIAWPVLIDMKAYRIRHMAHHRFTRTEKDPENFLYTPFPVTRLSLARKILRDLTGLVFLRTQIGIFKYFWGAVEGRAARLKAAYLGPLCFNTGLFAVAFVAERIDVWLVAWLIPMMTTHQLFLRIRNIAEHAAVPDTHDPLKNSRTTKANILERLCLAPYFVNYHIEHHLMPFVPCFNLPKLHQIMLEKGYGSQMEIRENYWDVLRLNTAP